MVPADLGDGGTAASLDEKARAVAGLYAEYVSWLEAGRLWDEAELLRRATARAAEARGDALWLILDETPLPELSYRFVRAVSRGGPIRIGRADMGLPAPAQAAARRFPHAPYPEAPADPAAGQPAETAGAPGGGTIFPEVQGDLFLDAALASARQWGAGAIDVAGPGSGRLSAQWLHYARENSSFVAEKQTLRPT